MDGEIYSIVAFNSVHRFLKFSKPKKAFLYYKNYRVDLISGARERFPLDQFLDRLNKIKLNQSFGRPVVFHLFYELGHFFVDRKACQSRLADDDLVAIEIHYRKISSYFLKNYKDNTENSHFKLCDLRQTVSYQQYQKAFLKGREHLLRGDCYQFNLTFPHVWHFTSDQNIDNVADQLMAGIWGRKENCAAYAHATVIPRSKKIYLSNSPECLFQITRTKNNFTLSTMPIKGSLKIKDGVADDLALKWKELVSCKKNRAELFMITDLLRNDLAKIEKPDAFVVSKRKPLRVPGILHQYSLIQTNPSYQVTLGEIVGALFPGGSITGAPKRRVMEILSNLEKAKRGFYCGSTIILYKSILAASINIRSCEVDLKKRELMYGAGGGITLESTCKSEFDEMQLKIGSFVNLLF